MRTNNMTADEAEFLVARMQAETAKPARIRLMQLALQIGHLDDGAKAVYRAALDADGAA